MRNKMDWDNVIWKLETHTMHFHVEEKAEENLHLEVPLLSECNFS